MNKNQAIISMIVQALVAVNTILMGFGITKFENVTYEMVYALVSLVAMVVAWGWGCWKNHPITEEAQTANELMVDMKENKDKLAPIDAEPSDAEVK